MGKTIHGHYGEFLENEAKRLKKLSSDILRIDINWREATDLAALRSNGTIWDESKLKKEIMKLRGIEV